ncbi:STAS domain-containing protein [Lentzea sp. NPDC051213]|uniref:STAS domain-containing protein n=1 Tax=Lentzea sp. NPDC051213 TaxID=3364126 RepID=UPI0037A72139
MTAVLQPSPATLVPLLPAEAERLTVTARRDVPGVVVLAVCGEVDPCTSSQLQDRLLAHLRSTGPPLIIDLTGVSFLGAAGLTVLVTVRDAAAAARVRLCVVANTRSVLRPLRITGLNDEFDLHLDLTGALLRLSG